MEEFSQPCRYRLEIGTRELTCSLPCWTSAPGIAPFALPHMMGAEHGVDPQTNAVWVTPLLWNAHHLSAVSSECLHGLPGEGERVRRPVERDSSGTDLMRLFYRLPMANITEASGGGWLEQPGPTLGVNPVEHVSQLSHRAPLTSGRGGDE